MRKTIPTLGIVSAGLLLAGSPAHAVETDMSSNLNIGVANGIQANLPIQAPVNLCGNAIGLLGSASAYCVGGADANFASGQLPYPMYFPPQQGYRHPSQPMHPSQPRPFHFGGGGGGGDTDMQTALNVGALNGIQIDAPIQAPINVCGNAIGILGSATASCVNSGANANLFSPQRGQQQQLWPNGQPGVNPSRATAPVAATPTAAKTTTVKTTVKTTTAKPMAKPAAGKPTAVKASPSKIKNAVAKPGKQGRKTEGGLLANLLSPVTGLLTGGERGAGWQGDRCGDVDMSSFGNAGIANGIQAHAPIQVPVNLAGNAIGLLGSASAYSVGGANANYCS
ncbi:hypothetical protein Rhe02_39780 [Rhizocola hellebori]|uniref:Chaplin domain-containing protein n=1 Tax=Rhizocola hellebori TaxID=1392758 RepID=A0A8J3Q8M7_9ACTN|nr:chaplin family protein [Rhizocola hellebori]GIH05911.1 hypothetical protein Rhe02_39780 [Rhizocola hellebori]